MGRGERACMKWLLFSLKRGKHRLNTVDGNTRGWHEHRKKFIYRAGREPAGKIQSLRVCKAQGSSQQAVLHAAQDAHFGHDPFRVK